MTEIKIAVSERTNEIIQEISDLLGIKRAEFVKNLVVESLREDRLDSVGGNDG